MRVGVVALQGGFAPHLAALESLGHDARAVRAPADLDGVQGLVLPGGESTAQLRLVERAGLRAELARRVEQGAPVLATCAGLVLAAARVERPEQPSFGWIDVTVARNGWGRQVESFEARDDAGALPLVLIRAPRIVQVGAGVEVLATLASEPILVRQGGVTAATFHPELTDDRTVHVMAFGWGASRARAGHGARDDFSARSPPELSDDRGLRRGAGRRSVQLQLRVRGDRRNREG
jgi:5'-phosphate synthase pdxT subunit